MKQSIQDKINDIKKLAQTSSAAYPVKERKNSIPVQDSLAKAIRNQKEADIFLAELELAIKKAHER